MSPTRSRVVWCALVAVWSLLFAAPHFYWAAGGRAGLGGQAAAADAALAQTWFAAYNLAAGCLGVVGAGVAVMLGSDRGDHRPRRWLRRAAGAASVVLLVRGLLGLTLLVAGLLQDASESRTPAVLLAIEPWFVLGGLAYGGMALSERAAPVRRRL